MPRPRRSVSGPARPLSRSLARSFGGLRAVAVAAGYAALFAPCVVHAETPPAGGLYRAGIAEREINPARDTVVIGLASSPVLPPSKRYGDLKVGCTVLEDAGGRRAAFVSADVLYFSAAQTDRYKAAIEERHGLAPEAVVLNAAHNHSAPPLEAFAVSDPSKVDAEYVARFESQLLGVVGDALAAMRPARLRAVADDCDVAVNRRLVPPGGRTASMLPNRRGPVDREVFALVLTDPGEEPGAEDDVLFGALVKYACHPVETSMEWVGPSFPGMMREELARRRPGFVAQFLQGCCGDCRPRLVDEAWTKFVPGGPERAREFGASLADAVERALTKEGMALDGPIASRASSVELPIRPAPRAEFEEHAASKAWHLARWGREGLAKLDRGEPLATAVPFRVQVVRVGEPSADWLSVRFVAFDGEIFSGYSHAIQRRLFPFATVALGYSNAMAGYVPTAEELPRGGYEVEAYRVWNTPGPFLPEIETIILDEATRLARATD